MPSARTVVVLLLLAGFAALSAQPLIACPHRCCRPCQQEISWSTVTLLRDLGGPTISQFDAGLAPACLAETPRAELLQTPREIDEAPPSPDAAHFSILKI